METENETILNGAPAAPEQAGVRITVELDWDTLQPGVELDFANQIGCPTDPAHLQAWEKGAVYGADFALSVARSMPCMVRITEMCGGTESTNPTLVAAATAMAVWEALAVVPPQAVMDSIGRQVGESESHEPDWLGTFGE